MILAASTLQRGLQILAEVGVVLKVRRVRNCRCDGNLRAANAEGRVGNPRVASGEPARGGSQPRGCGSCRSCWSSVVLVVSVAPIG